MYTIKETDYPRFDVPNVLHTEKGFVYLDEYTQAPHMVVKYKDHYVDYEWSSDHYWRDARQISVAEFNTKPNNLSISKQEMFFHLAEEFDKKMKQFMSHRTEG